MNMQRISLKKTTNERVPKIGKSARKYFESAKKENTKRKNFLNRMRTY